MTEQNTFAFDELQQKANEGDAQAQFDLALCYLNGTGIEKNEELAFNWHKKAAEQGHVNAQFALGLSYLLGDPKQQQNNNLIFKWVNGKFVDKNIDPAFDLGVSQALSGKLTSVNDHLAFVWLRKATEQNHAEANYWLGICYRDGIGTQQNDDLAFNCFKQATEQYCLDAYYWLALCYRDGKGVKQSDNITFNLLTTAVENAAVEPDAFLSLGELYADGKGVAQSNELAFHWYEKAAEKKVAEAQYRLAQCYEYGIGVEMNISLASKWYEVFAECNFCDAESEYRLAEAGYRLAHYYFDGKGVDKNNELGMKWMIIAARQGHVKANNWLTNAYISLAVPSCLIGKEKDDQYFKFAFNKCNEEINGQNAAEANLLLAVLYLSGKGVEQSDEHAFKCFKKAELTNGEPIEGDENEWMFAFIGLFLLICYDQGKGIEKDNVKANQYEKLINYDLEILGRILIEGISAMCNQCILNNKVFFTQLMFSFLISIKEYDLAKGLIDGDKNTDAMETYVKHLCLDKIDKARELDEKNKRLENANHRMQRLVEQFTHTLGNVIFPDTIYQVAERLKNKPGCRKDVLLLHEAYHSEIIIKLQGELLRQRYANTNPEKFRQLIRSCRRTLNTAEKTKSIEDVLDYAASRVTARFLNQHYAGLNSIRDKILSKKNGSLNDLKQKFEDDILLNKSLSPIGWINENLRPIQIVEISPIWKKVLILAESHAEALLFGYFSEILFNAFKYADHDKDEFLRLIFDEKIINDTTYLSCSWENPVKDKAPSILGSGKGLDAIQEDLKQLNDTENPEESLIISQQKNQFQVTLFFKKDLLVNELPILKIKRKANTE